jgi:protein-tyrosine phosphatase
MIDLHCHVLPGLDDGPRSLAESVELCRVMAQSGTTVAVATPHVSADWPLNTFSVIGAACQWLSDVLAREAVPLSIVAGAEVAMGTAARLDDEQLHGLHLGGGPWLLIECPAVPSPVGFDRILYSLQECGHRIVLGHPERCPAFQRDPAALLGFLQTGMLCSVTSGSLVGRFGRTAQRMALRLMRDGLVHNIASDAHNLSRRPPGLSQDLQAAGVGPLADYYAGAVPRAILSGDDSRLAAVAGSRSA